MKLNLARFFWRSSTLLVASFFAACAATSQPEPEGADQTGSTSELVANDVDNYRLAQGDQISIQVFDEPDLTLQQRVSASGVINYSYLGDLRVSGKTAQELESEITELLRDGYLVNPAVNVAVLEYRPFFINGEVRSPGSYPFQPGLTLDKAIALAGGLTDRASTRKMFVQKASNNGAQSKASMSTPIAPGDIISIQEGFF